MKKATKILLLTIIALTLCYALILTISGDEETEPPSATTHVAFVVYDDNGATVLDANGITAGKDSKGQTVYGFVSFADAVRATNNNYVIKMVNDYEEGAPSTSASISIQNKNVTLDLNGYTWASSYTSTSTGGVIYQRLAPKGEEYVLKVVGSGTVRTATSFICLNSIANVIIDPGADNTMNFVAIGGYKYISNGNGTYEVTPSVFTGDPMLKIGGNKGNESANITIRGNITYKAEKTNCNFIGLYEDATVTVEDAVINADLYDSPKKSVFTHTALSHSPNPAGGYYSDDGWKYYDAPRFTIKNSTINSPYGKFMDITQAREILTDFAVERGLVADYSYADKVVIENSKLNFNGNGVAVAEDFAIGYDLFADIRITNSEIETDAAWVFNFNTQNILPKAVVILKDTTIDTATYDGANQIVFNKGGTVIVDGGFLNLGLNDAASAFLSGYSWTTASEHTAEGEIPDYANPDSKLYDPTIAGYGHLIKKGTIVTKLSEAGERATLYNNYNAFVYEADSRPITAIVDYNGHPIIKTVVSDEIINYDIGGTSNYALYTFENADVGEYKEFEKNAIIDNAQLIVSHNGTSRSGLYNVVKSPTINNKYFTHSHYYVDGMSAYSPYISVKNAEAPLVSGDNLYSSSNKNITSYTHYALDIDMMSPNANIVDGTYIQFIYHSWGAENGSRKTLIQSYATIYFEGDDSLTKIYTDSGERTEVSLPAGKWFHLSAILKIPTDDNNNPDVSRLSEAKILIYIDGEHICDFSKLFDSKFNYSQDSEYYFDGSLDNAFIDEVRIGFPSSNENNALNGETTSFDNILLRNFKERDGNEDEIANYYKRFSRPEDIVAKSVKIRWEDADGKLIDEKTVASHTRISHPELTKSAINDYYAAFDTWMYNGNAVEETYFAPSEDMTFVKGALVTANFTDVQHNISLDRNPALCFYLPTAFVDGKIATVKFNSISADEFELTSGTKKYKLGTSEYYKFELHLGYSGLDTPYRVTINYDVIYDGITYTVSRNFKADALLFCDAVLSDTSGTYKTEEKTHIANLIRFANIFKYLKTGEYSTSLSELYDTHKSLSSSNDTDILNANGTDYSEISKYIKSINMRIIEGKAQYVIEFRKRSYVNVKSITITEEDTNEKQILKTDRTKNKYYVNDGENYCLVYNTKSIDFSDFFGTLEITLEVGDSKECVSGTYNLGNWYKNATFNDDSKEAWAELLYAMRSLGNSQKD